DLALVGRVVDLDLRAVGQRRGELVLRRVEDPVRDLAVSDVLIDLRRRDLLGLLPVVHQRLARQVDEQDDDDQGEKCGAEETVHEGSLSTKKGSTRVLELSLATVGPARSTRSLSL